MARNEIGANGKWPQAQIFNVLGVRVSPSNWKSEIIPRPPFGPPARRRTAGAPATGALPEAGPRLHRGRPTRATCRRAISQERPAIATDRLHLASCAHIYHKGSRPPNVASTSLAWRTVIFGRPETVRPNWESTASRVGRMFGLSGNLLHQSRPAAIIS